MQFASIPFRPIAGSTVTIAATTTSANVAIPASATGATAVRVVMSAGTADVRVRSGVGSGTTATSGDPLVKNASTEVFGINASDTYVAAITPSGTATVEFTFGFGA